MATFFAVKKSIVLNMAGISMLAIEQFCFEFPEIEFIFVSIILLHLNPCTIFAMLDFNYGE
jgi:hypothetical protein